MFRQKERLVTADFNTSKGFTLFCRQTEEERIWFIVASLRVRLRKINTATDKKVPTQHSFQGNSGKKNINAEKLPLFRDSDFSSPPLPHNSSLLEVETKSLINTIKTSNKQKKNRPVFLLTACDLTRGSTLQQTHRNNLHLLLLLWKSNPVQTFFVNHSCYIILYSILYIC